MGRQRGNGAFEIMTYQEYMRGKHLMLCVAPTGYLEIDDRTEHIPTTAEEIATEVYESHLRGATIAHLHGRREDGSPAPSRLPTVARAIREQTSEVLIEYAVGPDDLLGDYLDVIDTEPHPDIAQVRLSPEQYGRRGVSESSRRDVDRLLEELEDRGVKPNLLVAHGRDLHEVSRLRQSGVLDGPPIITLKMGAKSGTVATPQLLLSLLDATPDDANVFVSATGPNQYPITTIAYFYGAHIRVGMEDNLFLDHDTPVETNSQLVQRVSDVVANSQRPFAGVETAKEILTLSEQQRDITV